MNELHHKSLNPNTDKESLYNQWANSYDDYVKSQNYVGPKELIKNLFQHINNYPVNNSNKTILKREKKGIKILDFGCGTGLVGEELRKTNLICSLHGVDISLNMINIALQKNCYNRIFNLDLNIDELPDNIKYDYIISSGVFVEGHVSFDIIPNLIKYLNSDGLLLLTVRDSYRNQNIVSFNRNTIDNDKVLLKSITNINYLDNVPCKLVVMKKL